MILARLFVGWASCAAFFGLGVSGLDLFASPALFAGLFAWLLAIIVWSSFGAVHEAEELADLLGEPLGTLILTLSIILIEVALISAVMLVGDAATLGRDTMFAALMIVLNGVVGLGLLIGGFRHGEQGYNLQGAAAYLAVIVPLSVISFMLPNFTRSTPGGTLTLAQEIAFSIFTVALYGIFLFVQTQRHRGFFVDPSEAIVDERPPATPGGSAMTRHMVLLVLSLLPVVYLAKQLAKFLGHGLAALDAPEALGGLLIAIIVLAPEGITALRAVSANQLQRAINLCLGASASTIGLTFPVIVAISVWTERPIILGLPPAEMVLLASTLILSALTFSGPKTTILEGAMHLVVFGVYVTLIFSP